MGSKLLQVNKYTLSYRLLYGNVQGHVFAKNCPVSLNWSDYMKGVLMLFLIIDMIEYKEEKKHSQEPSTKAT